MRQLPGPNNPPISPGDSFGKVFSGLLDAKALGFLAGRAKPRKIQAQQQLLRAGEVCTSVHLLLRGAMRLSYYRRGKEYIGEFFTDGDLVANYSSFVTNAPSRLFITASEPCELLVLTKGDIDQTKAAYPMAMEQALRVVAERHAVVFAQKLWSSLMDTPTERYLALRQERSEWFARFPQYMIASYLGLTPEGLSKLRRRLEP